MIWVSEIRVFWSGVDIYVVDMTKMHSIYTALVIQIHPHRMNVLLAISGDSLAMSGSKALWPILLD